MENGEAGNPLKNGHDGKHRQAYEKARTKLFDPSKLTPHSLNIIARNINENPRKCFDYATTAGVFLQHQHPNRALHC